MAGIFLVNLGRAAEKEIEGFEEKRIFAIYPYCYNNFTQE